MTKKNGFRILCFLVFLSVVYVFLDISVAWEIDKLTKSLIVAFLAAMWAYADGVLRRQ